MSEMWEAIEYLRTALTKAEARIEALETALASLLKNSTKAKHRIEHLETALAAVVRALAHGRTTDQKLYGHVPHRHDIEIDLGLDEEEKHVCR